MTRVGIAGLGLIGGSLLRGLAAAGDGLELHGYDASPAVERAASEAGFRTAQDTEALAHACEIAIVAAPPAATPEIVTELLRASPALVVADTASVKREVLERVAAGVDAAALGRFVPAHPLAGAQRGGWSASDPGLLGGAVWAVCPPGAPGSAEPLSLFSQVIDRLAGRIIVCSADDHDSAVARTSHVPHVAAQALAQLVGSEGAELRAALSGGGYRDMTRVVDSEPGLWLEILRANRAASMDALDELLAHLEHARDALGRDDGQAVQATWQHGASLRRLVDAIRWEEPAWEQASAPWPCWDELLRLGLRGRSVRRLHQGPSAALAFDVAREAPRDGLAG